MAHEDDPVSLREITLENLNAVLALRVAPGQEGFVASNAVSIAQAHFAPGTAWFRAVYRGEEPVGFVMVEDEAGRAERFLWRFMIDARHQRAGIGRRALELVIAHVRGLPGAVALETSVVDGEGGPGPFYEKLGFAYTGAIEEGERVMRLDLGS